MSWHLGRLAGFDLESTGIDVEQDRIVTACVVQCGGGHPTVPANWLADPGIEIPDEAAKVHGITTEVARAKGRPAREVVDEVLAALGQIVTSGIPVVAMNARFDLTMLDREAARHDLEPLPDGFPVIDVLVLDKQYDRYRKGSRNLTALCEHYSVRLDNAHSADADALAACRLAWRMGQRYERIGSSSLEELHTAQVQWARLQAEGLREYFAKTPGKEHQAATVRTEWPLIPRQQNGA